MALARERARRPPDRTAEPEGTSDMQQGPRVAVIGLDCATPQLLFDDLRAEVPTIAKLMDERDVRRPRQHHAAHHGARPGRAR